MTIARLSVTTDPPEGEPGRRRSENTLRPSLLQIETAVRMIHPWTRPIVWLHRSADGERDLLSVLGGADRFHLQICDPGGIWYEAVDVDAATDPAAPRDEVCVWESDQGFATTPDRIWPLPTTLAVARHDFETCKPWPDLYWKLA